MLLTPSVGERPANRRMPPERTTGSLAGMERRANIYALDKAVRWLAILTRCCAVFLRLSKRKRSIKVRFGPRSWELIECRKNFDRWKSRPLEKVSTFRHAFDRCRTFSTLESSRSLTSLHSTSWRRLLEVCVGTQF